MNILITDKNFKNYEKTPANKNENNFFDNKIIIKNKSIKKETKIEKKERIKIRMLVILNGINRNILALNKQKNTKINRAY